MREVEAPILPTFESIVNPFPNDGSGSQKVNLTPVIALINKKFELKEYNDYVNDNDEYLKSIRLVSKEEYGGLKLSGNLNMQCIVENTQKPISKNLGDLQTKIDSLVSRVKTSLNIADDNEFKNISNNFKNLLLEYKNLETIKEVFHTLQEENKLEKARKKKIAFDAVLKTFKTKGAHHIWRLENNNQLKIVEKFALHSTIDTDELVITVTRKKQAVIESRTGEKRKILNPAAYWRLEGYSEFVDLNIDEKMFNW